MLEIKNLTIKIGDRYIVKDLSFTLKNGDKLAIIGEEGNGKSTLLKCILGISDYAIVSGIINKAGLRIGYLEQVISDDELSKNVFSYLFLNDEDYYNKINDLYKYLALLKLSDSILKQTIRTLSGGEKVKINILKLLLEEYDIYFLDEPTNDLDIKTLEWLEDFINYETKPIIFISHDETLLSNTANFVLHLEQVKKKQDCRHTYVKGSYDDYVDMRLRKIAKDRQVSSFEARQFSKQKEKLNKIMNKVEYQQKNISRSDPHGAKLLKKKMHAIKAQEKRLNNMVLTEAPDVEEGINFYFNDLSIPKNKIVLKLALDVLQINKRILARNIKLDVKGEEHVCIIGDNGVGKTTLLKEIYDNLKERLDIKVGYMPQNYNDLLESYDYVLDFLALKGNKDEVTVARNYLGNMKFTHDEVLGKISDLSNGSKAKLILVYLILNEYNVLILDEPTRNVSPLSNPVIRKALREFKGTIISVSHDRKYIKEVASVLYKLTKDGLIRVNIN